MCKFTLTIKLENYKAHKYQGMLSQLRVTNKISEALREIFEQDQNIGKINTSISDEKFCY